MRSNLGLSGSAFTQGRIMIEKDIDGTNPSGQPTSADVTGDSKPQTIMCPEEKDLKKLQIDKLKNAIAIPIFDK